MNGGPSRQRAVNGPHRQTARRCCKGLYVSFPESGINFSVVVKSLGELADALLMICSYSPPAARQD